MHDSVQQTLDIAIIGGGVAGVTLAVGLMKYPHIKITVYESSLHHDHIGWGFAFGPNAQRAMKLIDPAIYDGFMNVANENAWESKKKTWFDLRYGEDVAEKGQRSGDAIGSIICPKQYTVSRAAFLNELNQLVPKSITQWGKRLESLEDLGTEGVRVRFQDGTEAVHSAVIGCDGIKSETRKFVLGRDDPSTAPKFAGKCCHRALIPMKDAVEGLGEELAMNSSLYLGPQGHINCFPVNKCTFLNVGAFRDRPAWDTNNWVVPSSPEELLAEFDDWGEIPKKIIGMVKKADIWAIFDYADNPSNTYFKRRVCVTGDAAHASTPFQGAGAAMAIEDSYVLGSLLGAAAGPQDIESALRAYDSVRRIRTQKLVKTSREAGYMWGLDQSMYGKDYEKIFDNASKRMSWIWNEDLEAEVVQGREIMKEHDGKR